MPRPLLVALFVATCLLTAHPLHAAPADFEARQNWYGIYLSEQKMGYAEMGQRLTDLDGTPVIEVFSEWSVSIKGLGVTQEISMDESEYTDATTLELAGYDFFMKTGLPGMDQHTRLRREGDEVLIETLANGQVTGTQREAWDPAIYTSSYTLSRELGAQVDPATGAQFTVTMFDPTAMGPVTAEMSYSPAALIYYNGVEVETYTVTSKVKELGMTMTIVETLDGLLLKTNALSGLFDIRLEDEAIAKASFAVPDLIENSKVEISGKPMPLPPIGHLEVRPIIADDLAELFPVTPRQRLAGSATEPVLVIDMLGPRQGPVVTLSPTDIERYLGSSLYVQPDHPAIRRKADEIVGNAGPATDEARAFAIVQWVYDNLKKELVPMTPNAVHVLEMGKGDCGEHAVLTAALLRAAGLPAKVQYGLVYTPSYGQGFFYHAWNSVLVDGHWLEVDSALGMFPADASHVTIGEGDDPNSGAAIMRLYGRLQFDVTRAVPGEFEARYTLGDW